MKKILYIILCMAAICTACKKNEIGDTPLEGVRPVSISAVVDWNMDGEPQGTKAQVRGTVTCKRYVMEIYADATCTMLVDTQHISSNGTFPPVTLDRSKTYHVLVWADKDTATYQLQNGLRAITLKPGKNADEAFAGKSTIEGKNNTLKISLKRAVASVTLKETGLLPAGEIRLAFTQSRVLNLASGALSGAQERTDTITLATDVDGTTTAVALHSTPIYLLATHTAQKIDFSLQYKDAAKDAAEEPFVVAAGLIANRNTNIQGHYTTVEPKPTPSNVMMFTVRIPQDDMTFSCPFPSSGKTPTGITVEWGDGSSNTVAKNTNLGTNDKFKHTYSNPGDYTITITSTQTDPTKQQIPDFRPGVNRTDNEKNQRKIIRMDSPLLNTGQTNFSDCFNGCRALESLPQGLFDKNTQVTTFRDCFKDCRALKSLPQGLFDKNTQVTTFRDCFNGCTGLKSLPQGLFDKNTGVKDFSGCFSDCIRLESLPQGLFDKNTQVMSFAGCFSRCTALKSLPQGLFDKNTGATYFSSCFINCTSLALNPTIFSLGENPEDRYGRFTGKEVSFNSCFNGVGFALSDVTKSVAPDLWNYTKGEGTSWTTEDCYRGCKANWSDGKPDSDWGTPLD